MKKYCPVTKGLATTSGKEVPGEGSYHRKRCTTAAERKENENPARSGPQGRGEPDDLRLEAHRQREPGDSAEKDLGGEGNNMNFMNELSQETKEGVKGGLGSSDLFEGGPGGDG
jgi:hypothetical protein